MSSKPANQAAIYRNMTSKTRQMWLRMRASGQRRINASGIRGAHTVQGASHGMWLESWWGVWNEKLTCFINGRGRKSSCLSLQGARCEWRRQGPNTCLRRLEQEIPQPRFSASPPSQLAPRRCLLGNTRTKVNAHPFRRQRRGNNCKGAIVLIHSSMHLITEFL